MTAATAALIAELAQHLADCQTDQDRDHIAQAIRDTVDQDQAERTPQP